jgi:anti-sigma-K factor RskA
MLNHEFLQSIPAYAAGALEASEKERLEEHLRMGCEICEPELRIYSETAMRLSQALANVPLSSNLKSKVHDRLEREGLLAPRPKKVSRSIFPSLLLAASLAAAAFAGFLYWKTNLELQSKAQLVSERDAQISQMEKVLQQQKQEINWLRDPAVQLALLTGIVNGNETRAKMIWHPVQHKGIFYVQSLPPVGAEKSYQLWVIGNQGPVSAGVFETDPAGSAVLNVSRITGQVEGQLLFAVTIEPFGGVPQPTGTPIMTGKPL